MKRVIKSAVFAFSVLAASGYMVWVVTSPTPEAFLWQMGAAILVGGWSIHYFVLSL